MTERDPNATSTPEDGLRPLLTYPEAAELLRIDVRTVYAMVRRGDLPAVKLGDRRGSPVRIDRRDLADYIDAARGARSRPR
jgi:excisionase family DNA binding protein